MDYRSFFEFPCPSNRGRFIGDLRQLVGENYKDKNECAKVIATLFARIAMTHQQALETYQELYDDSRPI